DSHGRSDRYALIEIRDIVVEHADAAIGHEAADRARHVGAVNGVFAAGQRHRGDAHGVARRAAGNDIGHVWFVALHFTRRRPCRVEVLALDRGGAGPLLAGLADADRIAHGATRIENEIKPALVGLHHDRARRVLAVDTDQFRPRLRVRRHNDART